MPRYLRTACLFALSAAIFTGSDRATLAQDAQTKTLKMTPTISLSVAQRLADACQKWASDRNLKVTIAVLDAGANLLLFRRMDGAAVGAGELTINKARTSALFPYPTHEWQPLIYGDGGQEPILRGVEHMPTIAIFGGGVPIITKNKHHIGGMAAGGAEPKQETACGEAALKSIEDVLAAN